MGAAMLQVYPVASRNLSGFEDDQDEMLDEVEPLQNEAPASPFVCEHRPEDIGPIRNMMDDSLCVGTAARRRHDNNDIHMRTCDGAVSQQWVFCLDGTIRNVYAGVRPRPSIDMCWQQSSQTSYLHKVECTQGNPYQIFSQQRLSRSNIEVDNNPVPPSFFLFRSSVNQNCVEVSRRRARLRTVPCADIPEVSFYFPRRGKVITRGALVNNGPDAPTNGWCAEVSYNTFDDDLIPDRDRTYVFGVRCYDRPPYGRTIWTLYENGEIMNELLGECMGRRNDPLNDPPRTVAVGPCDTDGNTIWRMKEVDTGAACPKYHIISEWMPDGPSDGCMTEAFPFFVQSCISPAIPGPIAQRQLWSFK